MSDHGGFAYGRHSARQLIEKALDAMLFGDRDGPQWRAHC